ncbi:MAG TPA: YraN family protein [Thioploca sp.]|nr:YraN family protein [Thioploca sp.]
MQKLGQWAEEVAHVYLCKQGLQPIERNYRCKTGEIDLIMLDEETLIFIEVRYRKSQRYGGSLASIDMRKQQRILTTATIYLQSKKLDQQCRFDVVLIDGLIGNFELNWIRDAFRAE